MPRGRPKKQRIEIPKDGEQISKKALKNSLAVFWGFEPEAPRLNPLLTEVEKNCAFKSAMGMAFNWYNAMCEEKNKKDFLIEYTEKFFPELAPKIKHVPIDSFVCGELHAWAAVARMVLRKWDIPQTYIDRLETMIRRLAKESNVVSTDDLFEMKKVLPRDSKVTECIGVVDGMLDDFGFIDHKKFPDNCMADTVLKLGVTANQKLKVHEYFSPMIVELEQVLDGSISEGYNHKKSIIKKVYDWLTGSPSEALLQTVRKKERKPRRKKHKTPAQLLKFFSYQKSDTELKLASIDPEDIFGAQQLWVFNTKTRKLGVFNAASDKGLTVTRKSIDNFNEKTSLCKKIRKPNEIIPEVISSGKVALRHLLSGIRAKEAPLKGHIGDTVLLLKAVK
jgi:hypothetical protein